MPHLPALLRALAGVTITVSSVLPWFAADGVTATGLEGGDGWITLAAGAALVGSTIVTQFPYWVPGVSFLATAAVAIAEVYQAIQLEIQFEVGIQLLLAGGALALIGIVLGRQGVGGA